MRQVKIRRRPPGLRLTAAAPPAYPDGRSGTGGGRAMGPDGAGTGLRAGARAGMAALLLIALAACADGASLGGGPAAGPPAAIRLTSSGLGPVGAGMPYAKEALAKALPGFTFDTVKAVSAGHLEWYLAAFRDGQQQAQFEPDATGRLVARIHLVGRAAAGPAGERIGMSFAETRGAERDCRPGHGEWAGMALCESDGGTVTYIYAAAGEAPAGGGLPPPSALAGARLVRMIWRSPTG